METVRLVNPAFPPIRFALPYLPDEIDPERTYLLRADIRSGTEVLFTSDKAYPVLTAGAPDTVQMMLVRGTGASAAPPQAKVDGLSLPARFEGQLPCADCPGISYRLELAADHSYRLHMTYEERDTDYDEAGTWQVDAARHLILHGRNGSSDTFAIVDPETLEKLDAEGKPIPSALNYRLKRAGAAPSAGTAPPPLVGTYWRLVSLDGSPVPPRSACAEPHLQLLAGNRFSATVGCNGLGGHYDIDGDHVAFSGMISTMMACGATIDDLERQLKAFLSVARQYRISGTMLTVTAQGGGEARFEAAAEGPAATN